MKTASSSPNFNYGYPTPGPQDPTPDKVMDHVFFLSNTAWKEAREFQQFDHIIIGSGFCALAYAERVLRVKPQSRVLIIERGPFFLPQHFQNLPVPYQKILGGLSETFPWTLSASTRAGRYIQWQHGMVPFFGGRSIMWSAWCPRPTEEEFASWPQPVIDAANEYFESAEELLQVISADEIDKDESTIDPNWRPIFGTLQDELTAALKKNLEKVPSATRTMAAPLAVGARDLKPIDFNKFAVPGPMLELIDRQALLASAGKGAPLSVVTNCTVDRILQQNGRATALETSRGVLNVGDANVILAMGTVPPTTLVLNSFPQVPSAGARFTAHFITAVVARVPRKDYSFAKKLGELELGAYYIAGLDKETEGPYQGQYHIQLTALSDKHPEKNAANAARHMPDVVATASRQQLLESKDYVVFVAAVLGEIDYRNPDNWVRRIDGDDPTTNIMLQVVESETDAKLWDTMDEGTFQVLERILSPKGASRVEYWHAAPDGNGEWRTKRPPVSQIRVPGLVHEGSTLWIGEDASSPVNLDYRLNGVDNVYVTGGGLWPASGSWNPTLTMVALAQHLADKLTRK